MSLGELLLAIYAWCDERAFEILIAAIAIPLLGTGLAWVGKLGRTDRDGRFIASVVVVAGVMVFLVAVIGLAIAYAAFDGSVLKANLALLGAPIVCLAGCLLGIKLVFPLSQLASVRSLGDIGVFLAASLGVIWLFTQFRGWGIIFFGGLEQLVIIGALGFYVLRRLYKRALGGGS